MKTQGGRKKRTASDLDDGQVGNHLEVAQIPGGDRIAEVEGSDTDQQVRKRNRATGLPRLGVELRRKLGHLPGKRLHRDSGENRVQVFATLPRLHCGLGAMQRSEEHTSELQSLRHLVCRLLLEKK